MLFNLIGLMSSLALAAGNGRAGGKLLSACYDDNSASACLQLSKQFAAHSPERAKLARKRACALGDASACVADAPGSVSATSEVFKIKSSRIEQEVTNLPSLLQTARLEARNPGFEFVQLENGSAFQDLGFRLGDILLEINGHALENQAQAMELFVLLRSETDFNVKLKRAGKTIERKYQIEK